MANQHLPPERDDHQLSSLARHIRPIFGEYYGDPVDHHTATGQHAISLRRLRENVSSFPESLREMRASLETALKLEHPHPHAQAMRDLLDQLSEQVADVRATSADEQAGR